MLAKRVAGALIGVVFGIGLCWSGMTSPDVIRQALLFEESYLFLFMGSAMATAVIGQQLLRRFQRRAVLEDAPIAWESPRPERRHVVGSLMFGVGWGVTCACPGPIATQVGQGIGWAVFTLVGVAGGVYLYLRRSQVGETEPASDRRPATTPAAAAPA